MSNRHHTELPLLSKDLAAPRAADLLKSAHAKMGFVPNMYTAMAHSPGLLETYLQGYERFRAASGFTPAEQDVVFLTISFVNGCSYCMAAHCFISDKMTHVPDAVLAALRAGTMIPDGKLRVLSEFTSRLMRSQGWPSQEDVGAFLKAGYTEQKILEVILAIAVKTLSNYTNHLFDTPIDPAFRSRQWSAPTPTI